MQKLILIRHSQSSPDTRPSREWPLTDEGRIRCAALAQRVHGLEIARIFASNESKMYETARLIAEQLGIPYHIVAGVQEHERSKLEWLEQDVFLAHIRELFAHPDRIVMGDESGHTARERFISAVQHLLQKHQDETIAIVSGATLISLFVAHYNPELEIYNYWSKLRMPDVVALSPENFKIVPGHKDEK